jgi:periodic tryptophan protein 1
MGFVFEHQNFVISCFKEDTTLMVYVCSLETGDLYVHHDYPIAAPVLCLENIGYDPGVDSKKGNLLAVSTMDPQIEIWDLDVINAVKPVVKLGKYSKTLDKDLLFFRKYKQKQSKEARRIRARAHRFGSESFMES